jgi:hypothetical protein
MSIQILDLVHGAVFSKIVRACDNKISIIEISSEDGSYKLDTETTTDRQMFIKYRTKCRKGKGKDLIWDFNSISYATNSSLALVCIERIDQNMSKNIMEICYLSPEKFKKLFSPAEIEKQTDISCMVSLKPGQSFRVKRQANEIELTINRNAIEKI